MMADAALSVANLLRLKEMFDSDKPRPFNYALFLTDVGGLRRYIRLKGFSKEETTEIMESIYRQGS